MLWGGVGVYIGGALAIHPSIKYDDCHTLTTSHEQIQGRTGEAFMKIAKTGKIQDFCQPNALLTLQEYVQVSYIWPGGGSIENRAPGL